MIVVLIVFSSLRLLGQSIPTISSDSSVKTSEFYSWSYDKERSENGHRGTYWLLDSNFKLYLGRTAHHPPSNIKQRVGSWKLKKDSIILIITKPKKLGLGEPTNLKYRIFQIDWTTHTGYTEKQTGEPLVLKSIGIILSENPEFSLKETTESITKYIRTNYKEIELNKEEESMRDWVNHDQIETLVRQYFNFKEIIIGIKQYRNENLWIR